MTPAGTGTALGDRILEADEAPHQPDEVPLDAVVGDLPEQLDQIEQVAVVAAGLGGGGYLIVEIEASRSGDRLPATFVHIAAPAGRGKARVVGLRRE